MRARRISAEYFNTNWLEYRKSVTEAGDWAATEWNGRGAIFDDVLGANTLTAWVDME